MTRPGPDSDDDFSTAPAAAEVVYSSVRMLRRRADFLAAARARRQGSDGMMVQARFRDDSDPAIGLGFTCSKKVGNAVCRNRAKRRLREVAREVLPRAGRPGWDYVLIGRPRVTVARPFDALRDDLAKALQHLHGGGRT